MDKININSSRELLEDWIKFQNKYKNPIFICDQETKDIVMHLCDDSHKYFWEPDFKNKMTDGLLFGIQLIKDIDINGLFIMENKYKENNE